jgi:phage tail sheath protein FI
VLRMISNAPRIWGARTLSDLTSMRYTNVKRMLIFLEQSILRGTSWVVFEPNSEPLWKSIRRDVGQFLTGVQNSGALVGRTPQEAFFVKCDAENNPPDSIDLGFVIVDIGVAIVRPAEFIVFRIGQKVQGEGE